MGLLGFIQYGGHPHQGFLCGGHAGQEGQDLPPWQQHQVGLGLKGPAAAVRLAAPGLLLGPRPQGLVGSAFLAEAPGDVVRLASRRAASPGSRWTWITPSGRVAPRASAFPGHGEEPAGEKAAAKGGGGAAAQKGGAEGGEAPAAKGGGKEDSIVIEIKLPEWIRKRGKEGPPGAAGKDGGLAIDINLPPDWKKNPEAGAGEAVEAGPVRKGGKTAANLEDEADRNSTASEEQLERGMVAAAEEIENGESGNKGAEKEDVSVLSKSLEASNLESNRADAELFKAMKKPLPKDKMHQAAELEADRFAERNPQADGELENPTCCKCGDKKVEFSPEGNCAECKDPPKEDTDRVPIGEGDCRKTSAKSDKGLIKQCKSECVNLFKDNAMEARLAKEEALAIPEPVGPRCCVCNGTTGKEGAHPVVWASKVDECAERCGGEADESFSAPEKATKLKDPKAQDEACQAAERKDVKKEGKQRANLEKEVEKETRHQGPKNKLEKAILQDEGRADDESSEAIEDLEEAELNGMKASEDVNQEDAVRHMRKESTLLQKATQKEQEAENDLEDAQLKEAIDAEHGRKRALVAPKPDKTNGAMCCECTKGEDEDSVSVIKWSPKGTPCKKTCGRAGPVTTQFPASQRCQIKHLWYGKRKTECIEACKYRIEVALEEKHEAQSVVPVGGKSKKKPCKAGDESCLDSEEE